MTIQATACSQHHHHRLRHVLEWTALAALTLAMTGPGFTQGLGHIPEEVRRVAIAVQMASSGDLNPHWFGHPASLLLYGLTAIYKGLILASGGGAIGGAWSDLRQAYLTDPAGLFLIGRGVARLAAIAAVIATLEIGARVMSRPWAFTAAILTALNPLFVTHAHRLRSDHLLTLFLLLGVALLSSMALKEAARPKLTRAAVLGGLAITYKYIGGSILVAQLLIVAASERARRPKVRSLALIALTAGVTTFLASPYLWVDLPSALKDIGWETTKGKLSWNPAESLEKMTAAMRYAFSDLGFAALVGFAALHLGRALRAGRTGAIRALRRAAESPYHALVLILLIYLGTTMLSSRWSATWIAPLTPLFTIILVKETTALAARLCALPILKLPKQGGASALVLMALAIVATTQISEDSKITAMRTSPTAMQKAEIWIQQNIPTNSRILLWQPVSDQDGFFPRIRVKNSLIYRVAPGGGFERVCSGERLSHYETNLKITEESCFPRPRIRSQSANHTPPKLDGFDFLITSSRKREQPALQDRSGKPLDPVVIFSRPEIQHRLSYPIGESFPEGDYGKWRAIQIYALSPA